MRICVAPDDTIIYVLCCFAEQVEIFPKAEQVISTTRVSQVKAKQKAEEKEEANAWLYRSLQLDEDILSPVACLTATNNGYCYF